MKIKLGEVKRVENKERHFGSSLDYLTVWVKKDGEFLPLMVTEGIIKDALNRASRNQEDMPQLKASWVQRLLNIFRVK